jgi:hypothetical protein
MLLALWLSKPLRWAVAGLALMLFYEGWKIHQQQIGVQRERQSTKEATNADNEKSTEVRDAVAAGKPGGLRDPAKREAARN